MKILYTTLLRSVAIETNKGNYRVYENGRVFEYVSSNPDFDLTEVREEEMEEGELDKLRICAMVILSGGRYAGD